MSNKQPSGGEANTGASRPLWGPDYQSGAASPFVDDNGMPISELQARFARQGAGGMPNGYPPYDIEAVAASMAQSAEALANVSNAVAQQTKPVSEHSEAANSKPASPAQPEKNRRPRSIRRTLTKGLIGLTALGVGTEVAGLWSLGDLLGGIGIGSSVHAWPVERSLQGLYGPNQRIILDGPGTDIYKVHLCWGCDAHIGSIDVGKPADWVDGRDFEAGFKGDIQLVGDNMVDGKPAVTWRPEKINGKEEIYAKVNTAGYHFQVTNPDCVRQPDGECLGNISKSNLDKAAPFIEGALAITKLGAVTKILSIVGLANLPGLTEDKKKDAARAIETYVLASKDFAHSCSQNEKRSQIIINKEKKFIKSVLSGNSTIAVKQGKPGKAITLSQLANGPITVELDDANGNPITSPTVPIQSPSVPNADQEAGALSADKATPDPTILPCPILPDIASASPGQIVDEYNQAIKKHTSPVKINNGL